MSLIKLIIIGSVKSSVKGFLCQKSVDSFLRHSLPCEPKLYPIEPSKNKSGNMRKKIAFLAVLCVVLAVVVFESYVPRAPNQTPISKAGPRYYATTSPFNGTLPANVTFIPFSPKPVPP
jgi:hypothetical protein